MTTFDDRQTGFEAKFAHDEEMRFRAIARRNRLLGLWAAGLLGRTGAEADAYAGEVVRADMREAGDEDVIGKVVADLAGLATEAEVRQRLAQSLTEAQVQLVREAG